MSVLILYTLPPKAVAAGRDVGEFDLNDAAQGVAAVLTDAKIAGVVGHAKEILDVVAAHEPDVIFNLCEAPLGRPDLEAHAAALFEWRGIPYTGASSEHWRSVGRKDRTKAVLTAAGVAVPRSDVFPCIVKPADEDGSAGIFVDSICADEAEVEKARTRIAGPALIEEFLPGREFAVSVWGNTAPENVAIGETIFANGLRLNTYASKWDVESAEFKNSPLRYDTKIEPTLREAIVSAARRTWRAVGARGYLRVDVRQNAAGVPCVLDVNPNPELGPGVGICRAAIESGWTWERFVQQQIEWAMSRRRDEFRVDESQSRCGS